MSHTGVGCTMEYNKLIQVYPVQCSVCIYQPMYIFHERVPIEIFLLEHESAFWTLCLMLLFTVDYNLIAFIKCNLLLQSEYKE